VGQQPKLIISKYPVNLFATTIEEAINNVKKMVPEAKVFKEGEDILYENADAWEELKIIVCSQ
jgi:hypothetical protein